VIALLVVVAYDVNTEDSSGRKRLRKVAKACVNKGQRVQNSVFECLVNGAEYAALKEELRSLIDAEKDCLRFYGLGDNYSHRIETMGRNFSYEPEGTLIL